MRRDEFWIGEYTRPGAGTGRLSKEIALNCARPTFATKVMGTTGDLALVMRSLGHTNEQTAMIYQHPSLEKVRAVVDERPKSAASNLRPFLVRHNSRHKA